MKNNKPPLVPPMCRYPLTAHLSSPNQKFSFVIKESVILNQNSVYLTNFLCMFSCIILHDSLTNHLNMIVKNLALFGERAGEHFALFPKPKEPFMIQKRAEIQFPVEFSYDAQNVPQLFFP